MSLLQLVPADKRPGKAPGLPAALRSLYQALGQCVAKDRTLLHQLPAEVRKALEHKVSEMRWSGRPDLDERAESVDVGAQPEEDDNAPDDVWLDAEPDDDAHG